MSNTGPFRPGQGVFRLHNVELHPPRIPRPTPAFEPSAADAVRTRRLLEEGMALPQLLVDSILDLAEYWPHSSTELDYVSEYGSGAYAAGGGAVENRFLIRCPPVGLATLPDSVAEEDSDRKAPVVSLGYEQHEVMPEPLGEEMPREFFQSLIRRAGQPVPPRPQPARMVVFTITSHDQGWAGGALPRGSYHGSWTFFEAGLERFEKRAKCSGGCAYDPNPPEKAAVESAGGDPPPVAQSFTSQHSSFGERIGTTNPGADVAVTTVPPFTTEPLPSSSDPGPSTSTDTDANPAVNPAANPAAKPAATYPILPVCALRSVYPPPLAPTPPDDQPCLGHSLDPDPLHHVQSNRRAVREPVTHQVVWSWRDDVAEDALTADMLEEQGRGARSGMGEFVRNLRLGDVVTLWAKARFPAWQNTVLKVRVDVYWAV